jgi:hypothetical protein
MSTSSPEHDNKQQHDAARGEPGAGREPQAGMSTNSSKRTRCFCERMCRRNVPPRAKLNFAKFAPYFNVGVPFGKVQSPRWAEPTLKYGAGRAKLSFARGWWIAHPIVCSGSASRRKSNIYVNTGTFANRVYPGGRLTKNNLM